MSTVTAHLPLQTTPFVGRTDELAEITGLLDNAACRLVTLVGPGGIGKTRLALEAAAQQVATYAGEVYFVPLQAITSPDYLVGAIADAIDLPVNQCCDPKEQLLDTLAERRRLLVLDNFEHLLAGADLVGEILAAAPGVQLVVTSREALNLQEEWLWQVRGLNFPQKPLNGDRLEDFCAVQLFVQSAQRVRADFSLDSEREGIARICEMVEGMPLGIELAATWVRVLSCDEIANEIARNLDFLKTRARNVEPRHRSMRVVLDHSWELLPPEEQDAFKRLSVFRGSFTREAAGAVAHATLFILSTLVDKSLVRADAGGRYELHELVRQYAERKLNESIDDSSETRDRHSQYYMSFLAQRWGALMSRHAGDALCEIEGEIKNIRVAWGWATVQQLETDLDRGLDSLWFFYDSRSWYREGNKLLGMAVDALRPAAPQSMVLARLLARRGVLCNSLGWFEKARDLLNEGLQICFRHEDQAETAFIIERLGEVASFEDRDDLALDYFNQSLSLYQEIGDRWGQAWVMNWIGLLTYQRTRGGRDYIHQSAAIFRELDSQWGITVTTPSRAWMLFDDGELEEAHQLAEEGRARCQEIGLRWGDAMCSNLIGSIDIETGDYASALENFKRAIWIALDSNLLLYKAWGARYIAHVLMLLEQEERAIEFFAVSVRFWNDRYRQQADELVVPHWIPEDLAEIVTERAHAVQSETTFKHLLADLDAHPPIVAAASTTTESLLTEREREILALTAEGMSNRAIAEKLFLSTGTVKWYLSQVYGKLGVSSRTQAIAQARESGWLA